MADITRWVASYYKSETGRKFLPGNIIQMTLFEQEFKPTPKAPKKRKMKRNSFQRGMSAIDWPVLIVVIPVIAIIIFHTAFLASRINKTHYQHNHQAQQNTSQATQIVTVPKTLTHNTPAPLNPNKSEVRKKETVPNEIIP